MVILKACRVNYLFHDYKEIIDSTILRNIGIGIGYSLIGYKSLIKGIKKLEINKIKINEELDNNIEILGEAIQTILRREGIQDAYEKLKNLTRNNSQLTKELLDEFIDTLEVKQNIKKELKSITVKNYIGYANENL